MGKKLRKVGKKSDKKNPVKSNHELDIIQANSEVIQTQVTHEIEFETPHSSIISKVQKPLKKSKRVGKKSDKKGQITRTNELQSTQTHIAPDSALEVSLSPISIPIIANVKETSKNSEKFGKKSDINGQVTPNNADSPDNNVNTFEASSFSLGPNENAKNEPFRSQSKISDDNNVESEMKRYRTRSLNSLMTPPFTVPGVPAGLELLMPLNYILIKQRIDTMEVLISLAAEARDSYNIYDVLGKRLYYAIEKDTNTEVHCLGSIRPFEISIIDYTGKAILKLKRHHDWRLYCSIVPPINCLTGSVGGKTTVTLSDGSRLGEIIHNFAFYRPLYKVFDSYGDHIMTIRGPYFTDCCLFNFFWRCGNADFRISMANNKTQIGYITKEFERRTNEASMNKSVLMNIDTGLENFGLIISADLNVRWKALILAASFLIHLVYYERPPPQDNRRLHRHSHQQNKIPVTE